MHLFSYLWAIPRACQDIRFGTGVWMSEKSQNLNCLDSGLFLAQFSLGKKLLKQKNSCKLVFDK